VVYTAYPSLQNPVIQNLNNQALLVMKLIGKIIRNNIFISAILHLIVIIVSSLSFLFVSASTITLPPPIEITFIGVPKDSSPSSAPKKTEIKKETPKAPPPEKIIPPPPKQEARKVAKKVTKPEVSKSQQTSKKEISPSPEKSTREPSSDSAPLTTQAPPSNVEKPSHTKHEVTDDPAGIAYEQALLALLSKVKKYPERARRRGVSGDGVLTLRLHRNGTVKDAFVSDSTGNSILDKELIAMVHRAAPLPPLPETYKKADFKIPVSFSFTE
jgi:periplasmic protein TonB